MVTRGTDVIWCPLISGKTFIIQNFFWWIMSEALTVEVDLRQNSCKYLTDCSQFLQKLGL